MTTAATATAAAKPNPQQNPEEVPCGASSFLMHKEAQSNV